VFNQEEIRSPNDNKKWEEKYNSSCSQNYSVSSDGMESKTVLKLFAHSQAD
jgi:hypothetical protein